MDSQYYKYKKYKNKYKQAIGGSGISDARRLEIQHMIRARNPRERQFVDRQANLKLLKAYKFNTLDGISHNAQFDDFAKVIDAKQYIARISGKKIGNIELYVLGQEDQLPDETVLSSIESENDGITTPIPLFFLVNTKVTMEALRNLITEHFDANNPEFDFTDNEIILNNLDDISGLTKQMFRVTNNRNYYNKIRFIFNNTTVRNTKFGYQYQLRLKCATRYLTKWDKPIPDNTESVIYVSFNGTNRFINCILCPFYSISFDNVYFEKCSMNTVVEGFIDCTFRNTRFINCNFHTDFINCDLTGCVFNDCYFTDTRFENCIFTNPNDPTDKVAFVGTIVFKTTDAARNIHHRPRRFITSFINQADYDNHVRHPLSWPNTDGGNTDESLVNFSAWPETEFIINGRLETSRKLIHNYENILDAWYNHIDRDRITLYISRYTEPLLTNDFSDYANADKNNKDRVQIIHPLHNYCQKKRYKTRNTKQNKQKGDLYPNDDTYQCESSYFGVDNDTSNCIYNENVRGKEKCQRRPPEQVIERVENGCARTRYKKASKKGDHEIGDLRPDAVNWRCETTNDASKVETDYCRYDEGVKGKNKCVKITAPPPESLSIENGCTRTRYKTTSKTGVHQKGDLRPDDVNWRCESTNDASNVEGAYCRYDDSVKGKNKCVKVVAPAVAREMIDNGCRRSRYRKKSGVFQMGDLKPNNDDWSCESTVYSDENEPGFCTYDAGVTGNNKCRPNCIVDGVGDGSESSSGSDEDDEEINCVRVKNDNRSPDNIVDCKSTRTGCKKR